MNGPLGRWAGAWVKTSRHSGSGCSRPQDIAPVRGRTDSARAPGAALRREIRIVEVSNALLNQLHSPQRRGRREERQQQQRRRSPRPHDFSAVCSFRLEEENPDTESGSDLNFAYVTFSTVTFLNL